MSLTLSHLLDDLLCGMQFILQLDRKQRFLLEKNAEHILNGITICKMFIWGAIWLDISLEITF